MATEFIRARNAELDAEKVLPRSALPYLAGWEAVEPDGPAEPQPDAQLPTPDEPAGAPEVPAEPQSDAQPAPAPTPDEPTAAPAAPDEPVTPGSTPVGRPTRKHKES